MKASTSYLDIFKNTFCAWDLICNAVLVLSFFSIFTQSLPYLSSASMNLRCSARVQRPLLTFCFLTELLSILIIITASLQRQRFKNTPVHDKMQQNFGSFNLQMTSLAMIFFLHFPLIFSDIGFQQIFIHNQNVHRQDILFNMLFINFYLYYSQSDQKEFFNILRKSHSNDSKLISYFDMKVLADAVYSEEFRLGEKN